MKDEALKKAEHALEGVLQVPEKISMMHILDVVRFIRQALAQPQQEPVAIVAVDGIGQIQVGWLKKPQHNDKLYTSPPARKPLTLDEVWLDDELMKLNAVLMLPMDYFMRVVKAVESAHNIKE